VPNAISIARLLGVPVFLWLVLGPHADGWAVILLVGAAASDWLDGKLARALHQESRLGQVARPHRGPACTSASCSSGWPSAP